MQQIYIESYFKKYNKLLDYNALISHSEYEEIERRVKIIEFFKRYGAEATREAFGVARSTIFLWMKKLKEREGDLLVLVPKSRAPRNKRQRQISKEIINFIIKYREEHPGIGQVAIKYALDEYCRGIGIKSTSESSIGRVIKDLKEKGKIKDRVKELRIDGRTGQLREKKLKKKKKLRRGGYKPEGPGDLVQMDSISIFKDGIKRYIISAVDIKTRFSFSYGYKSLTSLNAKDFMEKLQKVFPFPVKRVQTDNGSEFESYLRKYLEDQNIIHYFNFPKHPQQNCYVERFNRTLQEQFVFWNEECIENIPEFNSKLMNYLLWFNTKKPHSSLNKLPPLDYFLLSPPSPFYPSSQKTKQYQSNMYRDSTT